jgi:hypothetical protein
VSLEGVFTYACPSPPLRADPQWWQGVAAGTCTSSTCFFSASDREALARIEAKLDELLARSQPEAEAVKTIRERVLSALGRDKL